MGIKGLESYIAKKVDHSYLHTFSQDTRRDDDYKNTLAVDFDGFIYWVCRRLCDSNGIEQNQLSSGAWILFGGCLDYLEAWLTDWIETLHKKKVSLVFVRDPPKCFGGCLEDHRKGKTHQMRRKESKERADKVMRKVFNWEVNLVDAETEIELYDELRSSSTMIPSAHERVVAVLRKFDIKIEVAEREADETLAQKVRSKEAFAILGEDSDFYCMKDVSYIPFAKLSVPTSESADNVTAHVYSSDSLAKKFRIKPNQLVDLAIALGNDYSNSLDDYEPNFSVRMKLPFLKRGKEVEGAVKWIKDKKSNGEKDCIYQNPRMRGFKRNSNLMTALYEIYRFYGQGDEFLKTLADKSVIKPKAMGEERRQKYTTLIEESGYSPMLCDIHQTKQRVLPTGIDPLSVKTETTFESVCSGVWKLLYAALELDSVSEIDPLGGIPKTVTVEPYSFLSDFLTTRSDRKSEEDVSNILKDLVSSLESVDREQIEDVKVAVGGMEMTPCSHIALCTVIYALLILQGSGAVKVNVQSVLTRKRMDALLLTALTCLHLKPVQKRFQSDDERGVVVSIKDVCWGDCAVGLTYAHIIQTMGSLRTVLGEPIDTDGGSLTYYSAVIFTKLLVRTSELDPSKRFEPALVQEVVTAYKDDLKVSPNILVKLFEDMRGLLEPKARVA